MERMFYSSKYAHDEYRRLLSDCRAGINQTPESIQAMNDLLVPLIKDIAGDGKVHGIFDSAVEYVRGYTDNIRIDTHEKNLTMQRHILKQGFVYCGIIITHDGTPRLAYQWSRTL